MLPRLSQQAVLILSQFLVSACVLSSGRTDTLLVPLASPDATEVLNLESNVDCNFSVDGKPVTSGRWVKIAVSATSHKIICQPEGYRAKEEDVRPPFNPSHPIHFTFLLEDRLASNPKMTTDRILTTDVDVVADGGTRRKDAYAIVIGIAQYREQLPMADFADHDAQVMAEYLVKVLGYPEENVVVRINEKAARNDFEKYFEGWLPNNVEKDSSIFIYYSGHGAPNPKTGDAYLVPYDGDPTFVERTGYPLKRLYAALDKLPAKDITVVLDSCFSGSGGRSVLAEGARPMVLSVENALASTRKVVVFAASSGDQISSTFKDKGHGLLTYFILKGLKGEGDLNKDGAIDLAELYEYVRPNVQTVARKQYNNEQTPQVLGNLEMLKRGVVLIGPGNR